MPGSTGRSTRYHLLVTRMPITHLVLSCSIILILPLTVSHPSCFDHSLSVVAIKKTVDTPEASNEKQSSAFNPKGL
jgi:hypothetical protein